MERRQIQDIMAFQTPEGRYVAFHARGLEVAEITAEAWMAMTGTSPSETPSEALSELLEWSQQPEQSKQSEPTPSTQKSTAPGPIRSLSLNVTQVCNLHCVYCAAGGDGTYGKPTKKIAVEKTLPQIKWFLEKTPTGGSLNINFLGGEPLLYPEAISTIGEYALELAQARTISLQFNVITNGTLFNEKSLAELKKINCAITISLDGPAEINDRVRPGLSGKSVTDQVLKGLQLLNKNRENLPSIGVQAVFGRHNSEVLKAYRFFRELGLDWYEFNYDQTQSDELSSAQFEAELIQAAQLALQTGGETELKKIKFFRQIFTHLDQQKGLHNFCGAGNSYAVVDAQNRIFTCPWEVNDPQKSRGSGLDLTLDSLQHLKMTQIEANNCGKCWARHLCGGGCMYAHEKTTGSKHRPDPLYCKRTRT